MNVSAARLPTIGGDNETWGQILNEFLNMSFAETGFLRPDIINTTNILDGTIGQSDIQMSSINSTHIANNALMDEDFASNANINVTKLSPETGSGDFVIINSLTTSWGKIANAMILNGTITAAKFVIGTITGEYISPGAINSSHILDGAITSSKIAPGVINATHLLAGSINSTHLSSDVLSLLLSPSVANGSITANKLAVGSVNTTHILNETILDEDIASNANISLSKLQPLANSHTHDASNITSGTIPAVRGGTGLASYTFGDLLYANSSSTLAPIPIGAVNFFLASNGTTPYWTVVPTSSPTANSVNSSTILDASINASDLATDSVNTTHILDLTILAADIADGVITAAKLVAGSITSNYIAANAVNTTHILNNTIRGEDINTNTNVTVNVINATLFDIGIETKTAECSTNGCTATATCTSGKAVIFGYGSSAGLLSGLSIGSASADCTAGATSCAVTESDVLLNQASVKIICAKIR